MLVTVFSFLIVGSHSAPVYATGAIRDNGGFNTSFLAANDDSSTGLVNIGFSVNLYGLTFSQLYVNNNGNVTFDAPLSIFTPFDLTSTGRKILAPFFADVDTRAGNVTRYGQDTVNGRPAFGVNWLDVGYFAFHVDKLNSFQLVMVDRSDIAAGDFDFEFNYTQIQWETGDASGGIGGFGGAPGRAGYSNGTGVAGTYLELAGSAMSGAFVDGGPNALISNSLNSNQIGRYLFQVRGGEIINVPVTTAVESCFAGTTSTSVVGNLPLRTQAYYEPGNISPDVFVSPGDYWVLGVDESGAFYKIILACQYLWVPVETMQPNYDEVWQGRPLPTTLADSSASK